MDTNRQRQAIEDIARARRALQHHLARRLTGYALLLAGAVAVLLTTR